MKYQLHIVHEDTCEVVDILDIVTTSKECDDSTDAIVSPEYLDTGVPAMPAAALFEEILTAIARDARQRTE